MNFKKLLLPICLLLFTCTLILSCLLFLYYRERLIKKEDFGRLGFSASGCFGNCPIMRIEIDSSRNYYFHGIKFTDKEGFYEGEMPDSLYKVFLTNLEKVQSNELKPNEHKLVIVDGQEYDFKIVLKKGAEIKYDILLRNEELTEFLLKSYKLIHLSPVDTLNFLTAVKI